MIFRPRGFNEKHFCSTPENQIYEHEQFKKNQGIDVDEQG
jgi:hypothetical protein